MSGYASIDAMTAKKADRSTTPDGDSVFDRYLSFIEPKTRRKLVILLIAVGLLALLNIAAYFVLSSLSEPTNFPPAEGTNL